ncbi:MAG: hypothetical protein QME51_00330 [Planctomycetota bacterium]|nr:hypothetical protein [Planctomycetota bacterium]MDI6786806.1 hypothetical protein [Planctomycetota bacterium]
MNNIVRLGITLGLGLLLLSGSIVGQETKEPLSQRQPLESSSSPTITAEWADKPVRSVLEYIGDVANINIIIDMKIGKEDVVTATFRNLDWKMALEEVVKLGGCILEEINPVLYRVSKPPTVSMDLKNAPLDEVVRNIAKLAGINIVMADDIKGTITMMLTDVPWFEALQNIIKTTGFSMVQEKYNVIRIVRTETLKEQLETRFFQLKYLRPPGSFKATITTPYAVGSVKPSADAIKDFTLLNILKNMLTRKGGTLIGSLEYDIKSNCIIVQDIKTVLDAMEKVLERLDVRPQQVLIELKFVSTANKDLYDYGLKYNWGGTKDPKSEIITSKPFPSQVTTTLPFGLGRREDTSFNQLFLNTYDVSTVLRLFKGDTKSKFIQEPNVVTLDGVEATVFVGELIRYAVTKVSYNQAGLPLYELAEAAPVNVGFQLWVLPDIVSGTNEIMLTVIPRLEDLSGTDAGGFDIYTVAGMTIKLPRMRQSTVVTRLLIESGQTAIIGGLVDERLTKTFEKVPGLGEIPILNHLFTYKGSTLTQTKLLVFVTPHIIKSSDMSNKLLQDKSKGIDDFLQTPADSTKK